MRPLGIEGWPLSAMGSGFLLRAPRKISDSFGVFLLVQSCARFRDKAHVGRSSPEWGSGRSFEFGFKRGGLCFALCPCQINCWRRQATGLICDVCGKLDIRAFGLLAAAPVHLDEPWGRLFSFEPLKLLGGFFLKVTAPIVPMLEAAPSSSYRIGEMPGSPRANKRCACFLERRPRVGAAFLFTAKSTVRNFLTTAIAPSVSAFERSKLLCRPAEAYSPKKPPTLRGGLFLAALRSNPINPLGSKGAAFVFYPLASVLRMRTNGKNSRFSMPRLNAADLGLEFIEASIVWAHLPPHPHRRGAFCFICILAAFCYAREMRCRKKQARTGESYPVKQCHSYPLPPGLAEGTIVKLVSFDRGFWSVDAKGKRFEKVFVSSVDCGWLYELNGRWLDEEDPEIIAVRKTV